MSAGGSAPLRLPRLCFFGTYASNHAANQLLLRAARDAGMEVVECHEPLWERQRTKSAGYFQLTSTLRLLVEYAGCARRLAARRRADAPADAYVVGFQGQVDLLLLRWLLRRAARPILFAPLVTLTETLVEDRRLFGERSLQASLLRQLDRLSLRWASGVIIDTQTHAAYLTQQFAVPASRLHTWYLGAETRVFVRRPSPPSNAVRVLFYGTFLPLHGVQTILDAALRLREESDIELDIYGEGMGLGEARDRATRLQLGNVRFVSWCDYADLGTLIAQHHICLGIFDTGQKARMVIPNKVYQAAAVGRPVITADTPAMREVFTHGKDIWLCRAGDADELAGAIRRLAREPEQRNALAEGAAQLMATRFAPAAQASRLRSIVSEVCAA